MPTPQDFARCQGQYRHAWDDYDDSDWKPMFGTGFVMRCMRCTTLRRDTFDRNGNLAARSYVYPQGYKYAKGERPSINEFRLMAIQWRMQASRDERRRRQAAVS